MHLKPCAVLFGATALASGAQARNVPRVGVFFQPGFPFYNTSSLTSPRGVARDLKAIGIDADLLDAAALGDAARCDAKRFGAVILPYGNTYPRTAFANLLAFHRAGGALVLSGIPFTHAVDSASLTGWDARPLWGSNVYSTAQSHGGAHALEVKGLREWGGVDSARYDAKPGDDFVIEGWVQNVVGEAGNDFLYVRFFNTDDKFLTQQGPQISRGAEWHRISAAFKAPPGSAKWDVSVQVRSFDRVLRLDDLKVTVNGAAAPIANANFETPGSEWRDIGHDETPALFGENGIGAGLFAGPTKDRAPANIAPGDPLQLAALAPDWPASTPQWLDQKSVPAEVKITPALLWQGHAMAALLSFQNGAVTVWTNHPSHPDADGFFANQLLLRGTVAALAAQNKLAAKPLFAKLNALPRPVRYANVKLPTPRRSYETFQPKSPALAPRLYVAEVRKLRRDERVLLISLQGIVNRKQPRVYLNFGEDDRFWLAEMRRRAQTGEPMDVANPLDLVETFRSEFRGAVVPDAKIYDSACVAASLAGADDLLIATPELAARLKLPIRADLRGKFADNAAALRYLRTEVLPRLNPYLACSLDPASHDNGSLDDVIAARGVVFWITGHRAQDKPGADTNAELDEVKALLANLPLNAVVRGFWWHGDGMGIDEGPGVSLGSRFGKVTIVSDGVANFSVTSGVQISKLQQKPRPAPPVLDQGTIYVALTMSDGDNLTTWRNYFRQYFTDPLHGTFPMGWGIGPTILDVAPTWAQWYYDKATPNDEFICDVSGVGYTYPPDWCTALNAADREAAQRSFYKWTDQYMERMDMRALRSMNVEGADITRVGELTPRAAFLMPDYGYGGQRSYPELTYTLPTGQPVFRAISYDGTPEKMANDIRTRIGTARPAFANVFIWNWGSKMKEIKKMLDLLGPDFVAVTPSQLAALYKQAGQ